MNLQKLGGVAALYIAAAYLAAMPYFLVFVNYPGVVDPVKKVELLRDHYASMHTMHLLVYEFVAIALVVLGLALYERLRSGPPAIARLGIVLGLMWACLLLASSMVFNYGMGTVVTLYASDPSRAVWLWQAFETVAQGIGGAGGELLGGLWMLLVSWGAQRARALPTGANGLGLIIAIAGLLSNAPPLRAAAYAFGLLQIVWFTWVGVVLVRVKVE